MKILLIILILVSAECFSQQLINETTPVVFKDLDGSTYYSNNNVNWRLLEGSGDWIVYQEMEKESLPYVLFEDGEPKIVGSTTKQKQQNNNSNQKASISTKSKVITENIFVVRPTADPSTLMLQITQELNQNVKFSIHDMSGNLVHKPYNIKLPSGESEYLMDISFLNRGIYFITMTNSATNITAKFIKE